MIYRTCHRCPLRTVDGVRCELLEATAKATRGLGLTSIKWICEKRLALFAPGDEVKFTIMDRYEPSEYGGDERGWNYCTGIVMRMEWKKALVCITDAYSDYDEGLVDAPLMWFNHDGLKKTGKRHTVCIHCGKPKDVELRPINKYMAAEDPHYEPYGWRCRYGRGEVLPCEYPTQAAPDA